MSVCIELGKRVRILEKALSDINQVLDVKFSSNNKNWSQELEDINKIVSETIKNK